MYTSKHTQTKGKWKFPKVVRATPGVTDKGKHHT